MTKIWSNWSSEILLAPRKKVKLSDEAKPQNLRCSNFTCTWEIRLEVKSSVSFSLFYKQNQTDQELEYSPSCLEEDVNIPYVSCHCSIPPTELHLQESSIVTVRPKQGNITLQSCFYIKFAPRNLTLQVRDQGEEYLATWNTERLRSATFRYEVCYGEGNASLIEESSDGEKCLQNKFPELLLILNTDIKTATMYYMRVRMRIDEPNPEHCYNGPWSEWSNFSTWETKTVLDLGLLYVMVPICFILLISSTLYGCKILKRTKEQWKARIPDPSKSIFINDFLQGSHLKCQYEENHHYEELFDVCKTMTSYKDFKDFTINEIKKEDVGSENMEQIDYDDSFGIFQNDDIDSTNLNVVISGYKPFSELIDDQKTVKQKDSQLLQNAYDGPYIFCSSNS
ncbi:cytokine receptor common subunit beta isoform X2 [Bombina bombina]|uniref:cytokine receptor common subunit beta isoform X2 n=1 Tax=Bombina bombina TaxID=8345 RepID=UPI00235A6B4C|nr:cytokine receptor common subunit beta isoform X2 [Bombina bombina]